MSMQSSMTELELNELEQFAQKLEQAEDEAAVNSVLKEYGCNTSGATGDELGEDDLANVAGGLTELAALKWLMSNTDWGKLSWKGIKVAARCLYDAVRYKDPYRTYSEKEVNKISSDLDKAIPNWMKKLGA